MSDPFETYTASLEAPAKHAAEIEPSDDNDLETVPRCLWIGGEGDLRVTMEGGEVVNFPALTAGAFLPIRVRRVHEEGTTATGIVALW